MAEKAEGGGRLRVVAIVLGALAAIVLVTVLGLWLARSSLATSVARSRIASRGLSCDERFAVTLDATLGTATVAPTRCTRTGMLEAVVLEGPATVELSALSPRALRLPALRLELSRRRVRGGRGWSPELGRLALEEPLAAILKALSELPALGLPETDAARVTLTRGGATLGEVRALHLGAGEPMPLAFRSAGLRGRGGQVSLREASGRASADEVTLAGRSEATATVLVLRTTTGPLRFRLRAGGLRTPHPGFRLRTERGG